MRCIFSKKNKIRIKIIDSINKDEKLAIIICDQKVDLF